VLYKVRYNIEWTVRTEGFLNTVVRLRFSGIEILWVGLGMRIETSAVSWWSGFRSPLGSFELPDLSASRGGSLAAASAACKGS
jgi:hypothetical protein